MSGNPKIIAITGATGFVGLHLVPHLLAQGYHVRALVRSPRKIPEDWKNNKLFQMVKGDISSDLTQLIQDADAVIHMAGLIKARTRAEFMSVNAAGCENIAQTAQACGVAKCVYLSSMTAREPQLSDYAASKRAGEQAFANHYTGETVIIRAPAVFGPKDEATKPIFDLMRRGHLLVSGRDWKNVNIAMVYINDLVSFITAAIEKSPPHNRPYEPATITQLSWSELAELAGQALGRPVRVRPVPALILTPIAAITTVTLRLFGRGHLSLQKLREFQHSDWTSQDLVDNPTPMIDALRETAASYET